MMRAVTAITLVACLALLGCAKADEAAAATYRPTSTAWSVISSNPALSQVAGVIQRLGLQASLNRPFAGTLLLPTDEAVFDYMSLSEPLYLHMENGTFSDPEVERRIWTALLEYHQLPRATSTRQRGMAVTLSTLNVDQDASFEAVNRQMSATKTFPRPGSRNVFHKLTFMCSTAARMAVTTPDDSSPQTFRRCEANSIRDEQNNTVTFASKNTVVLGGGLIHTVNSVLQPNNVYPTLSLLIQNDPDFSIFRDVVKRLADNGTCWTGRGLQEADCCMCGSAPTYLGDKFSSIPTTCFNGSLYIADTDSFLDEYPAPFGYCANGTYVRCPTDSYGVPIGNCSTYGPIIQRAAADQGVSAAQTRSAACGQLGICGLEGIKGTFSLPDNEAFRRNQFGPTDLSGIPVEARPSFWQPIVQFAFIPANNNDYVDFNMARRGGRGGFPTNNRRTTLLGTTRNDASDNFRLTFDVSGNQRVINFRSANGPANVEIKQASKLTTPHTVHKIRTALLPPCHPNC